MFTEVAADRPAFNRLEWQRQYRINTEDACTKKYERTKKGKLVRTYRNMMSRVLGVLKTKTHLYLGLTILTREEFYNWSLQDEEFNLLYDNWVESGYNLKLSPSIDREDASKGYDLGNIRWVTHSENSRRGGLWKKNG